MHDSSPIIRLLRPALATLAVGSALAAALAGASGHHGARVALVDQLAGPPSASPTTIHPSRGVAIGVDAHGVELRNRGDAVGLSLVARRAGAWQRRASGASRAVGIGTEVVRYGLPATEEYVVVDRHLGTRTLEWRLSPGIRPILAGSSVRLVGPSGSTNLALSPVRVLDGRGRDVTPAGTHWQARRAGDGWRLALRVHDNGLPTPYVIDPTVTFRAISNAKVNASTTASVTLPAATAAGDLVIVTMSINTTASSSFALSGTAGACSGGGTKVDETHAAAHITQIVWSGVAVAGDGGKTCKATWTGAGEVVMTAVDYTTGTYYAAQPVDFGAIGSAGTSASTTYTSNNLTTFFSNEFLALIATEDANKQPSAPATGTWTEEASGNPFINTSGAIKVGIDVYDGASRAVAGSGTVTGTAALANNTIAAVIGIRQSDTTAPTVSLTAPTGGAALRNGASLTGTVTDSAPGSGPQKLDYYYCVGNVTCNYATAGKTLIGSSSTGTTYPVAWSSMPADGTYTVFAEGYDNAGNHTSSARAVVTVDNTAPSAAITAPANGSSQASLATVTGTSSDASAVTGVTVTVSLHNNANGYWNGTSFTGTSGTATAFTATTANAYATWSANTAPVTWPGGQQFDVVATATDGAGNTTSVTGTFSTPAVPSAAKSTLAPASSSLVANGVATRTLTVQAKDASGNAVSTGGATVTITKQSGTGTVSAVTDNGNGTYTATVTAPGAAGSGTFVATLGGSPVQSGGASQTQATVTYTAGPAAKLVFDPSFQPAAAQSGTSTGTVEVLVEDATGNVVTGDTSTVTVALTTPGGATLSGTKSVAAVAGVATFTGLSVDKTGTYSLTATDGSLTGGQSAPFTITPGAANGGLSTVAATTPVPADGSSATAITVTVRDVFGNAVPGATVSLAQGAGHSSLAAASGTTNASGVFTTTATDTTVESVTYTATVGATTLGSAGVSFAAGALNATVSSATAAPVSVTADGTHTSTLTVTTRDAFGHTLAGLPVAITQNGASTITPAAGTTDANGVFTTTVSDTHAETVTYTVASGATQLLGQPQVAFTPGAPAKVVFDAASEPQSATSGASLGTVAVRVLDANGNLVTTDTSTVTVALTTPGGATLTGTKTVAAVAGTATFTGLSVDRTGTYTLTATDNPLTSGASTSFTVAAGPATHFAVTVGAAGVVAGTSADVTVTAVDAFGNVATGYAGIVHVTSDDPQATLPPDYAFLAGDNGTHTFGGAVTLATTGTRTVSAGDGSISGTSAGVAVGPAAPDAHTSTLTPVSATLTADGVSTQTLTVHAEDAFGNDVLSGGAAVAIAKHSGTGTVSAVTDHGNGTYTATVTAPSAAGSGVFVATLGGSPVSSGGTGQTQATIAYVAGAASAARSTLTPATAAVVADGASTQMLTVRAKDANGNDVAGGGASVTITKLSGTGAVSAVTDHGDGTYTATVTAPATVGSGTFVATLGGAPVESGSASQTPATVDYVAGPFDASHSTVQGSSGTASTDGGNVVTVTVTARDAHDNPIAGAHVVLDQGVGTIASVSPDPLTGATTGPDGTAIFLVGDTKAEGVVFSAAVDGSPVIQTAGVSFTPGAAAQVVFGQEPGDAAAGAALAPAVTVRLLDAHGNLTTSTAAVGVAISSGTGAPGATLAGTTSHAASAGVATFGDVSIARAGTGYRLTATSGGATVDSSAFAISAGPPSAADSSLAATPTSINSDGSSGNATVTLTTVDAYGNAVATGGAAVALTTDHGTLSGVIDHGDGTYTATLAPNGDTGTTAHLGGTIGGSTIGHGATVAIVPPVPVLAIDSGASDPAPSTSATFAFHSTNDAGDPNLHFECSLDGAAWGSCTSPASYTGLADGAHTFAVRGITDAGTGAAVTRAWTSDHVAPAVSLTTAPGTYSNSATEPLAATASDATTGVASVSFRFAPAGSPCGSGTTIGTDSSAPFTATWTTPADGTYDVCAVAVDAAGNASTDSTTVTVDRTAATAVLSAPAANLRGTIVLHASSVTDATSGVATVDFEREPHGSSTWTPAAAGVGAGGGAYDGSFDTTTAADGLYDLRVRVVDAAGNVGTDVAGPVRIDNTPPTTTIDPVAPDVRGTIALGATSVDAGSGVASTTYEISPHGAGTWAPVPGSFDTTAKADGDYDLRAVATDNAGNVTPSASVTTRIDNTPPTAALAAPAAYVHGSLALDSTGTADGGSGLATVRFEISDHGASSWSTVTSPLDTTTEADGDYDLRVVAIDNAGNRTDSAIRTTQIDNSAPDVVSLDAPAAGAVLRGTLDAAHLTATTHDALSGIATTDLRLAAAGTLGAHPCAGFGSSIAPPFDTSTLADGHYDVWVAAADRAGNGRCSAVPHDVVVDNTAPVTTDDAPFGTRNGDVTVTLVASDNLSGVASTEYRVDGGSWTAGTSVLVPAPADHSNDGTHTIDYRSIDGAGNVEAIRTTHAGIDTTAPTGSGTDPAGLLRGTVQLAASPSESDIASVTWQYRPVGAPGAYTPIGSDTSAPWTTAWITSGVLDGAYDLQVVFTDTTGNSTTQQLSPVTVDNTAPGGAAVTSPSASADLGGTIIFASTATDATSGIDPARTTYEVQAAGDASFHAVGSAWSSTSAPDGPAQVRVLVWDKAGNGPTYSPALTFVVDNTTPTVAVGAPAATNGTAGLTASGSADIASVLYEYRPHGGGGWTTIGSGSAAPFAQPFATGALPESLYDVRATATDGGGNQGTDTATVRVDRTGPVTALTQPAGGATVGGASVPLAATATDVAGSLASVTFRYRAHGSAGPYTIIASLTSPPFTAGWDATAVASGDYDLEVVATDDAGNSSTVTHTVTVDSTPPVATFTVASPTGGTISLHVSTTADAASVAYAIKPSSGGSWTTIGTSTGAPGFAKAFDTTSLADGAYDFRSVVADGYGNATTLVASTIDVDNSGPAVTSSAPSDGAVVPSASDVTATASEPVASVTSLELDGSPAGFAASVAGSDLTFPTGPLAPGVHSLTGTLVDAAGNATPFRINLTVYSGGAGTTPATSKNVSDTVPTALGSADGSAAVTVPANVWQSAKPSAGDWLVLAVDPSPAPWTVPASGSGVQFGAPVLDVTMFWNLAKTYEHAFDAPVEIDLTDPSGGGLPATAEPGGAWRAIPALAPAGVLPAAQPDGYWRTGATVHILTRHLSLFTVLLSTQVSALAPPIDFAAVVASDGLTLRWAPGMPAEQIGSYVLYVDGVSTAAYGARQFEAKLGPIASDDPRRFWLTETDLTGAQSSPTPVLRAVPPVVGLTVDRATTALGNRTFSVGHVTSVYAPDVPEGTVVAPTGVSVQQEGSAIDLQVATGSVLRAPFGFAVAAAPRLRVMPGTLTGRAVISERSRIDVTLDARPFVRIQRWHFFHVKPGAAMLSLRLRRQLKPGTYRLYWKATSDATHVVRRRVTPLVLVPLRASVHTASATTLVVSRAPAPSGLSLRVAPEDAFLYATYHDVAAIVVDADSEGMPLVRRLRRVFPSTAVVAVHAGTPPRAVSALIARAAFRR